MNLSQAKQELITRKKRSQRELRHSQSRHSEPTERMIQAVGYQEGISQALELLDKLDEAPDPDINTLKVRVIELEAELSKLQNQPVRYRSGSESESTFGHRGDNYY